MPRPFRVIDTGLRGGRENIAFDAALIEARRENRIPDTIRFLAFEPTALVGRHQALSREVRVEHCRAHGIGLARRITGGGAIYFDPGQLGWELVCERGSLPGETLADVTRAICTAAASGLSALGLTAAFRPRNDIEVEGRKLCGTGGFFDGGVVFFQGTLLIECDLAAVIAALNVPQAKLEKRGLDSAAQRMVTLSAVLGDRLPSRADIQAALLAGFAEQLDIAPVTGMVSETEEALAQRLYAEEIGTDAFVFEIDNPAASGAHVAGVRQTPGGTVTAYVKVDRAGTPRVAEALITGDFFAAPPRLVLDLEAALRGVAVDEAGAVAERVAAAAHAEVLSVAPADFRAAIEAALEASGTV